MMENLDYFVGLMKIVELPDGEITLTELNGGNYKRVMMTQIDWMALDKNSSFTKRSVMCNTCDVRFPEATEDWGVITHWALYRTAESESPIIVGDLSQAGIIMKGFSLNFAVKKLIVDLEYLQLCEAEYNN